MVVVMVRVRVRDRVRAALRLGATPTRANQDSARGPHLAFTATLNCVSSNREKKVLLVGRRLEMSVQRALYRSLMRARESTFAGDSTALAGTNRV